MPSRRIVIAPDSFKGTATAREVATALAAGWSSVRAGDAIDLVPMADGGEGTIDAFETAFPGSIRHPVTVLGPDDRPVDAAWLALPDGTAVVELASTSGITLVDELVPATGHTIGFGEAVSAALDAGADRLLLGIGGSCSTDGGVGLLRALGARFLDAEGGAIGSGNAGLADVAAVDLTGLTALPTRGALAITDVTSPLLGAAGAAAVFGPQKGVWQVDVPQFDARLQRLAALLPETDPAAPGAGAAGGAGFGLLVWGATLVPGAAAVADALGLRDRLVGADVVITGEGRFDAQSLTGKVPSLVLERARASGIVTALVAGRFAADTTVFEVAVELTELAGSMAAAMAEPARWLEAAGAALAVRYSAATP